MATLTGSDILAKSLVSQGMDTLFYIMGGPMIETEAGVHRHARRRPRRVGRRVDDHVSQAVGAGAAYAWRSGRDHRSDRAAREGRAPADPRRQRRLVVGRGGGVPGVRRSDGDSVL